LLAHTHTHTPGRRFKAGVSLINGLFKRALFTVILFCSLFLTSSCEDDFSETEIEQKEAGTTFKLQPKTFSQNAGSTMEDLLVLEQFLATRSDLLAQNPFDANWGSFDTSRSVKVEVSPSLTTTTFKITPNLINDRYFTNVVVTKLDGEIKKVVYSSYLYSQAFYDKYHNNGEHMSKFSGYNLQQSVLDLMNNSTCSEFAFFYVPEEGDILSGGAGDGPPGFYTNTNNPNHNENLADFTNAWSNSNWAPPGGGSSGNGSGESNGDNTISTVIGVVGDAVGGAASSVGTWFGDSWQSIKRWFRNLWCNCGGTNRFAENFTGTEPGNLIIYTEPVDANEPITDPCDRILMGILADEYSPQHISDFLGISLADLNYLMKQEHLQFFINSLSLLYESSFSTNAINHFHEALQDYKDSQSPITDLEFVYSSFDDMLEKDAQKQNVIDFLVQNNYSDEAFAFLREAMPALQDNDGDGQPDAEVDFTNPLSNYNFTEESSEILAFEQDYRNRMSQAEIAIFDNLSRFQQLDYLHSAYLAQEYAKLYFEEKIKVQYNGKGDAYRHTLWNALGTAKLGKSLMKQLTDAHEVPDSGATNNPLEKAMDLHNNQIGRNIGSQSSFMLMMKVKFAVDRGETKYLSPTNSDGSVIPNITVLKNTNEL
jgi:hypothetical protein